MRTRKISIYCIINRMKFAFNSLLHSKKRQFLDSNMFSSIVSKVEAFVDYWQEPNVTRAPHNFTDGVWVRDLPGVEGGVTYNRIEVKKKFKLMFSFFFCFIFSLCFCIYFLSLFFLKISHDFFETGMFVLI